MTTRIEVNLNDECTNALQAYMAANNVNVTEAIRRAISLLNYHDVAEMKRILGQD